MKQFEHNESVKNNRILIAFVVAAVLHLEHIEIRCKSTRAFG